jgi:hypothetical protein
MRWIAASPRAKHSLCGMVRSAQPLAIAGPSPQREGSGGGGRERRCNCGEESGLSEKPLQNLADSVRRMRAT